MMRRAVARVGSAFRMCTPSEMQIRGLHSYSWPDLPHANGAIEEPCISGQITEFHGSQHYKTYVTFNNPRENLHGAKDPALQNALIFNGGVIEGQTSQTIFCKNLASNSEKSNEVTCSKSSDQLVESSLGSEDHMISVTFVDKHGDEKDIKVPLGMSMLEAAHQNGIELEGACEGSLACSTCHVIVMDEKYYNKLPEPSDEENDMLDLAFGLTETSRLGCQVLAKPELDGMRLAIPSATRNFAVDGYVPKPH